MSFTLGPQKLFVPISSETIPTIASIKGQQPRSLSVMRAYISKKLVWDASLIMQGPILVDRRSILCFSMQLKHLFSIYICMQNRHNSIALEKSPHIQITKMNLIGL